jgi:hypothetical protein
MVCKCNHDEVSGSQIISIMAFASLIIPNSAPLSFLFHFTLFTNHGKKGTISVHCILCLVTKPSSLTVDYISNKTFFFLPFFFFSNNRPKRDKL